MLFCFSTPVLSFCVLIPNELNTTLFQLNGTTLQNNNNVKPKKFILTDASLGGAIPGLSWSWASDRAFLLFQLMLNAATTFLQTPIARETFGCFSMVVVIARCKLWPKHVMLRHGFSLQAFTMFPPFSVVIAAIFVSSSFQSVRISLRLYSSCWPVCSSGTYFVPKHRFRKTHLLSIQCKVNPM